MLPNEVLLSIFYFGAYSHKTFAVTVTGKEAWQSLAHVCRRWQRVIFGSPRCLDLQLFCAPGTHRDNVNVWPPLPLVILDRDCHTKGLDNIVALLEYSDRVREINLKNISSLHYFEKVLAATQKPFPQLTNLTLWSPHRVAAVKMPVDFDSFLGASAPHLRELSV